MFSRFLSPQNFDRTICLEDLTLTLFMLSFSPLKCQGWSYIPLVIKDYVRIVPDSETERCRNYT